jgi:D-serine deaminase-like pyridoxal phosphate-dependent protein
MSPLNAKRRPPQRIPGEVKTGRGITIGKAVIECSRLARETSAMLTDFEALETPVPLVDLDRLQHNLDRMAGYAAEHGLELRPHIKTHKSPMVAGEQILRGATGLTCATINEVEVMSEMSRDILLAYSPIGQARLQRLMRVSEPLRLSVMLDSTEAIDGLAHAAERAERDIDVLVELDLGMHRVGVQHASDAVTLARQIEASPRLRYAGIGFYPGNIRDHVSAQQPALTALNGALGAAIGELERVGLAPRVVSGGSTPTAFHSHLIAGLTEIRPGTYVFNDRTTADIGACDWHDCALTVLATVVSVSVPNQAVIDAGSKALGREPFRGDSGGYGVIVGQPDVVVDAMSEEHGLLDLSGTSWRPAIGDLVRVIPNHACIVVHLNDKVVGVRGDAVMTRWQVAARGR